MYSYPNLVPLSPASVRRIVAAVEPYAFDAIYGAFRYRVIPARAKEVVRWSAERYIAALGGAR
ncbi:MAG TPA: hypothetical protein VFU46_01110 [Gemmatimonadales bacterium]|nr:hypothetical protein [Gemmatimonadales bacterium]